MPAVETLKMSSRRGPDVGYSLSSHQREGPVHAVETLEMPSGRELDVGNFLNSHRGKARYLLLRHARCR